MCFTNGQWLQSSISTNGRSGSCWLPMQSRSLVLEATGRANSGSGLAQRKHGGGCQNHETAPRCPQHGQDLADVCCASAPRQSTPMDGAWPRAGAEWLPKRVGAAAQLEGVCVAASATSRRPGGGQPARWFWSAHLPRDRYEQPSAVQARWLPDPARLFKRPWHRPFSSSVATREEFFAAVGRDAVRPGSGERAESVVCRAGTQGPVAVDGPPRGVPR